MPVLVGRLVVAGGAARLAIHQSVNAQTNVELRLAENAELLAIAAFLRLLALGADNFAKAGFRGHGCSVVAHVSGENMTEVTGRQKSKVRLKKGRPIAQTQGYLDFTSSI